MEDNKNNRPASDEAQESNAARRIRALGEDLQENACDEPLEINRWENFWYHHKAKVIIIAAFTFIIGVAVIQFVSRSNPDVSLIYSGPDYITANMNQAFCDVLEGIMDDYDGDGKKYAQLNDLVFMTEEQIAQFEAQMEALGEEGTFDRIANAQASERFTYEIFGSEASICLLAKEQYEMVRAEGGFVKLSELFGEELPEGAVDEYGVLFADTKLCRFYDAAKIFPDGTILALRRLSTMSALTGKQKAERMHSRCTDLFKKMLTFDYPEGYVPPEETSAAEQE
ncbi:MAG: hypothetical protein IJC71_03515 [Clostridia bacterium]|nr:hypothetical protein [Clostridia bacterium]